MTDQPTPAPSPLALDFAGFLAAIRAFRRDFLIAGTDFGVVPGTSDKPTLLKPGAEKVCAWLHLRAAFEADHGSWVQAGSPPGLFAYVCRLVDPDGQVVGEGRGSAHCEEGRDKYGKKAKDEGRDRPWPANVAIKFAEKRALIDAVLRVGCLSAEFTQDLEDMEAQAAAAYAAQQARQATQAKRPPVAPTPAGAPPSSASVEGATEGDWEDLPGAASTPGQHAAIRSLLPKAGITEAEVCTSLGVKTLADLPAAKAGKIITRLQTRAKGAAA